MKFECLSLREPLLRGLQAAGYCEATPIQQKAIPQLLKGRDVIGCAQTGTGKTAAFALPMLDRLMQSKPASSGAAQRRKRSGRRAIRTLILAPTRELAAQIGDSIKTYGRFTNLRHEVIFGGVSQKPQVRSLQTGVDILVATPGRLLDLIGQGFIDLTNVEMLILDEADQMLDMGFIHDLRKIVARVPDQRQTLMFSATMPPTVRQLARQWLRRPFELQVAPVASTPAKVSQAVCFVERQHKAAALTGFIRDIGYVKTLVFSRTKRGADKIARVLNRDGIHALAIHGNKSQSVRTSVIQEFGSAQPPVLVATDLAARGLDFSDVLQVINYDLPDAAETYVHRIGRTARAGASGQAVSFCGHDERRQLRDIERLMGQTVPVVDAPAVLNSRKEQSGEANSARPVTGKTTPVGESNGATPPTKSKRSSKNRSRRNSTRPGGTASSAAKVRQGNKGPGSKRKTRPRPAGR